MNKNLLIETGEALFGSQWIRPMSRAVGVNERTVQRWASGVNQLPEDLPSELVDLLGDRTEKFVKLMKKLQRET